jgi:two-component SAPR family response regulator
LIVQSDGNLLAGKQLLIVEDEILVALPLLEHLEMLQAHVIGPIGSVSKALQVLEATRVDAAILDVNLAGQYVWPVAESLAAAGTPFLFLTGYIDAQSFPSTLRNIARVSKPSTPEQVVAVLKQLWAEGMTTPVEPGEN